MLFWYVSLMTVMWVAAVFVTGFSPLLASIAATTLYYAQSRILPMDKCRRHGIRMLRAVSLLGYSLFFTLISSQAPLFFFATALYAFLIDDLLLSPWRKDNKS